MVLNPSPQKAKNADYDRRIEALLNSYASPGTRVELAWPDNFGGAVVMDKLMEQGAANGLHHAVAIPSLVRKTVWAEQNGYDAVIQSNTFEPGVDAGRLVVRIPVIGLLRTALHAAATLADRIALTVPFNTHVPYTRRIVRSHGMQGFVTDIRALQMYTGPGVGASVAELTQRSLEVMKALVDETGAEAIIPMGGLLFPYAVDPADLEKEVGVPVLNTKVVGIRFAEMCATFRMAQSRATYPTANLRYEDFLEPVDA